MIEIHKIGFELEGEYSPSAMQALQRNHNVQFVGDGSIHRCADNVGVVHMSLRDAELRSAPFVNIKYLENILALVADMEKMKHYHFNDSMGFHIHVSFIDRVTKSNVPVEIYSASFNSYFMARIKDTFPQVYKTRANNRYCMARSRASDTEMIDSRRYYAINCADAYRKHGTIEFRIWPADTAKNLLKYLHFTVATINEFLANADKLLGAKYSEELSNEVFDMNVEPQRARTHGPEQDWSARADNHTKVITSNVHSNQFNV